jgi:hypothetical protein
MLKRSKTWEWRNKKELENTWTGENKFHFSISEKTSKKQNLNKTEKKVLTRKVFVSDFNSEETITSNAVQER